MIHHRAIDEGHVGSVLLSPGQAWMTPGWGWKPLLALQHRRESQPWHWCWRVPNWKSPTDYHRMCPVLLTDEEAQVPVQGEVSEVRWPDSSRTKTLPLEEWKWTLGTCGIHISTPQTWSGSRDYSSQRGPPRKRVCPCSVYPGAGLQHGLPHPLSSGHQAGHRFPLQHTHTHAYTLTTLATLITLTELKAILNLTMKWEHIYAHMTEDRHKGSHMPTLIPDLVTLRSFFRSSLVVQ